MIVLSVLSERGLPSGKEEPRNLVFLSRGTGVGRSWTSEPTSCLLPTFNFPHNPTHDSFRPEIQAAP